MNRDEIKKLLTAASVRDNRKLSGALIDAWQQDLGDLPYGLAEAALRWHYQHSNEWLMAAHIRTNATFLEQAHRRAQRLQREAEAAAAEQAARDTRPLRDRRPEVQALVRAAAARLTTPASLSINARWRARRITSRADPPPPAATGDRAEPAVPKPTAKDIAERETQAVQALHDAGRPCGQPGCTRLACREG